MSASPSRLPVLLRRCVRLARLAVHLVAGVVTAACILPCVSPARRQRIVSRWAADLLACLAVRLAASPPPPLPGGALLVCNHVSWLDIYVILATRHVHFVSKSEVRGWPVVGWLAARVGTLFLERGRRADTARINQAMQRLLDAGEWVAVFPEGTTSDGRGLLPFHPSLLQPAVALQCPVAPAAIRYTRADGTYHPAAAYIDDTSLWQSVKAIADADDLVARIDFGVPLAPSAQRRTLAAHAHATVAALLVPTRSPAADADPKIPPR